MEDLNHQKRSQIYSETAERHWGRNKHLEPHLKKKTLVVMCEMGWMWQEAGKPMVVHVGVVMVTAGRGVISQEQWRTRGVLNAVT